jgi:radical SAM protein with 4Fe4S-binding SPASM domain
MEKQRLKQEHIQLIPIDKENTLFFHTETLQIYPLQDKELIGFLSYYKENGREKTMKAYSTEDFKAIDDFIHEKISEAPVSPVSRQDINRTEFIEVVLPIAACCNLNCPYCFAQTDGGFHFGNFTEKDIDRVAAFLVEKNTDEEHPFTIIFFGGEPLLKFDIMQYTVQHFKEKYPSRKVNYSITTNGTLLNEEIIRFFIENNVAVLLSLDGPENEFNVRDFRTGGNSTSTVLKNIELLKRHGINFEIRATLINTNPYVVETCDFFEKLKVRFMAVFAYESENKDNNFDQYDESVLESIKTQMEKLLLYYVEKMQTDQPIYNKWFETILSEVFRFRLKRQNACGAGVSFFTITANGDIFSCSHFLNNPKYRIGNISEGIIDKSHMVPIAVDEIGECAACWVKHLCRGGCLAQKISTGKSNVTALIPNACALEKLKWNLYIRLYYYVLSFCPQYFELKEKAEALKEEGMH